MWLLNHDRFVHYKPIIQEKNYYHSKDVKILLSDSFFIEYYDYENAKALIVL